MPKTSLICAISQSLSRTLTKKLRTPDLTKQSLSDLVFVALKRDVPKLKVEISPLPVSAFCVRITSVQHDNFTASFVAVSVVRPADIVGDQDRKIRTGAATVWDKGVLVTGSTSSIASRVREFINESVTAFAAQYYKDNP